MNDRPVCQHNSQGLRDVLLFTLDEGLILAIIRFGLAASGQTDCRIIRLLQMFGHCFVRLCRRATLIVNRN